MEKLIIFILILFIPLPFWYNIRLFDRIYYEILKQLIMAGMRRMNFKNCSENLILFDDIMKKCNIKYWLSEGTALGVVRDGDFIPWDDDVDVGLFYEEKEKFIKCGIPELRRAGFKLVHNYKNWFSIVRKHEKMDIDIVQPGKFCIACKTHDAKCRNCDAMIPFIKGNLRTVDFLGRQFVVPGDSYLEYLYGPTWRTPRKQTVLEKYNP
jgi:hypothetical protein